MALIDLKEREKKKAVSISRWCGPLTCTRLRLTCTPPREPYLRLETRTLHSPVDCGSVVQNFSTSGWSCETFALLKSQLGSHDRHAWPHTCVCRCWRSRLCLSCGVVQGPRCTGVVIAASNSNSLAFFFSTVNTTSGVLCWMTLATGGCTLHTILCLSVKQACRNLLKTQKSNQKKSKLKVFLADPGLQKCLVPISKLLSG